MNPSQNLLTVILCYLRGMLLKAMCTYTIALQKGEETRFVNGESTLFLLNAREQKTIESEQKLVELKAKVQKAAVNVKWAAGVLAL